MTAHLTFATPEANDAPAFAEESADTWSFHPPCSNTSPIAAEEIVPPFPFAGNLHAIRVIA